ncbi:MAG: hypothetical protein WC788_02825 [Candidatus Paceibacterota bacterium]|jgi:hypothetical protein
MVSFAKEGSKITAFEIEKESRERFGRKDEQNINGNFERGN